MSGRRWFPTQMHALYADDTIMMTYCGRILTSSLQCTQTTVSSLLKTNCPFNSGFFLWIFCSTSLSFSSSISNYRCSQSLIFILLLIYRNLYRRKYQVTWRLKIRARCTEPQLAGLRHKCRRQYCVKYLFRELTVIKYKE